MLHYLCVEYHTGDSAHLSDAYRIFVTIFFYSTDLALPALFAYSVCFLTPHRLIKTRHTKPQEKKRVLLLNFNEICLGLLVHRVNIVRRNWFIFTLNKQKANNSSFALSLSCVCTIHTGPPGAYFIARVAELVGKVNVRLQFIYICFYLVCCLDGDLVDGNRQTKDCGSAESIGFFFSVKTCRWFVGAQFGVGFEIIY